MLKSPFLVEKSTAAEVTDEPQLQGLLCNPVLKMKDNVISFLFIFPSNGAPVE
jgi:hypothetical protein